MNHRLLTIAVVLAATAGCGGTTQPTLTPLEIQALQSKEFETTKDSAFAAVVTVFQDMGYIVDSADKDTGFITASNPTTNTTTGWNKMTYSSSNSQTRATAFVEERGESMTRVRLNFVVAAKSSSRYGRESAADTPILDAEIYEATFNRIDQAVFVRSAMK
jgi:hypothetical protein